MKLHQSSKGAEDFPPGGEVQGGGGSAEPRLPVWRSERHALVEAGR
jgi:hypothetical protein